MTPGRHAGERVDVVDERDGVVRTATRGEVRADNLLHRGCGVLLRRPTGEIFIHRRTDVKDVFPGLHDMFIGGVVAAGEDYADTARREVWEEAGVPDAAPLFLFKHRYRGPDNNVWAGMFQVTWDGPVRVQEAEIAWHDWWTVEELDARLDDLQWVPDGLEIWHRLRAEGLPPVSRPRRR